MKQHFRGVQRWRIMDWNEETVTAGIPAGVSQQDAGRYMDAWKRY